MLPIFPHLPPTKGARGPLRPPPSALLRTPVPRLSDHGIHPTLPARPPPATLPPPTARLPPTAPSHNEHLPSSSSRPSLDPAPPINLHLPPLLWPLLRLPRLSPSPPPSPLHPLPGPYSLLTPLRLARRTSLDSRCRKRTARTRSRATAEGGDGECASGGEGD